MHRSQGREEQELSGSGEDKKERLAKALDLDRLDALTTELPFDELPAAGPRILAGEIRGRCVVPISA